MCCSMVIGIGVRLFRNPISPRPRCRSLPAGFPMFCEPHAVFSCPRVAAEGRSEWWVVSPWGGCCLRGDAWRWLTVWAGGAEAICVPYRMRRFSQLDIARAAGHTIDTGAGKDGCRMTGNEERDAVRNDER